MKRRLESCHILLQLEQFIVSSPKLFAGSPVFRYLIHIVAVAAVSIAVLAAGPAMARSWFKAKTSGGVTLPQSYLAQEDVHALEKIRQVGRVDRATCGNATCLDLLVTLNGSPQGDERKRWVEIMEHFADAIWEATEKKHKLRNIRIYRNSTSTASSDIHFRMPTATPSPGDWPNVPQKGGILSGGRINMYASAKHWQGLERDFFSDPERAGYVLAHEMGHYFYGLYDEYGIDAGDKAVSPSIMRSEGTAAASGDSDKRWLNFSVAATTCGYFDFGCEDYRNKGGNEQMRKLHASAWQVLARSPADDPAIERQLAASRLGMTLGPRMHHPELAAVAPKGTGQPVVDLADDSSRSTLYYLNADGQAATVVPAGDPRSELRVIWMDETIDNEVVVVLDRSGSMTADRLTPAKQAAKALVDQFNARTRIAILSFSTTVTTVQPLTLLDSDVTRNGIKSAIDTITAGGDTAIGDAAQAALDLLLAYGSPTTSRVVLLLTDGENNSGVEPTSVLPAYRAAQVPLITFGYGGSTALLNLLQSMSSETGGQSFQAPTTGQAVIDTFQSAAAMATEMPTLIDVSATAPVGQVQVRDVIVDPSVGELTQSVSHPGAATAGTVQLRAPNGVLHSPSATYESGGETTRLFRIPSPAAGTWQLQTSPASAALNYRTVARASTRGETYDAKLTPASGKSAGVVGKPVKVLLTVARGQSLARLTANARLRLPDGSEMTHVFSDSGAYPDDIADDGIYSAEFWPGNVGRYRLLAEVTNPAGQARCTTVGGFLSAGPNGEVLAGALGEVRAEPFARTATLDIDVSPDFGTAMGAGNTWFASPGDFPWRIAGEGYAGGTSAQSAVIGANQSSTLQTTVRGPGNGSFHWKVGSERSYDNLRFFLDDVEQQRISGALDWTRVLFAVPEGEHVIKWVYAKDGSVSTSPDAGWIDQFLYGLSMPLTDVPASHWAYAHISRLYHSAITTGCGGNLFCPSQNVTRGQMAAFIVRAKEGEPSGACTVAPFTDVPAGDPFCKYIQRMAALGVTTGCGGGKYCPANNVTRQEMAAFIIRALEGNPVASYCGTTSPFSDVPANSAFCGHAKRLLELNITTGCGAGKYCPTQTVNRETMAVFLARAFLGM